MVRKNAVDLVQGLLDLMLPATTARDLLVLDTLGKKPASGTELINTITIILKSAHSYCMLL